MSNTFSFFFFISSSVRTRTIEEGCWAQCGQNGDKHGGRTPAARNNRERGEVEGCRKSKQVTRRGCYKVSRCNQKSKFLLNNTSTTTTTEDRDETIFSLFCYPLVGKPDPLSTVAEMLTTQQRDHSKYI